MTPFLKQVRSQGWKLYEIGKIRGLKKRQMTELSKSPTQWDWLALKGLGDKREEEVEEVEQKYKLECKSCQKVTTWEATGFFDAADKMPTGWKYDRLFSGIICPECSL